MATRLLLTLLALLAGLAAQFTPAQARGSAAVDVEIGAAANVAAGHRQAASRIAAVASRQPRERHGEASLRPAFLRSQVVVPTVLQGIDRGRE